MTGSVPGPRSATLGDDAAAFSGAPRIDVLFRRSYADLLRLAVCLVGDRRQASDAVQEAFASLDRRGGRRLRDHAAAADELTRAVIGRSRRRARLRTPESPRTDNLLVDTPGVIADEGVTPGSAPYRMDDAVEALPRRQREVLVARYYLDRHDPETAALLHVPPWFVARARMRALHTFRDRYGISAVAEVEDQVREDLHARAQQVTVTDRDVDEAWWQLQGRLAERTSRRTRQEARVNAAAAALLALVVGVAAWQEVGGTHAAPAKDAWSFPVASYDCFRPSLSPLAEKAASAVGFVATRRDLTAADEEDCRPVVSFSSPPRGLPSGSVWLFADGRLITAYGYFDGLYQQRLSSRGIEQVRSAAAAMLADAPTADGAPSVRLGGRLVQLRDHTQFASRLFDLSWLPRTAWLEKDPTPYEALWHRVCFAGGNRPLGEQQTLGLFAYPANDSLATLDASPQPVVEIREAGDTWRQTPYCAVVPSDKVARLFELVRVAGLLPEGDQPGFWVDRVEVPDRHAWITVTPVIPNGEISALEE